MFLTSYFFSHSQNMGDRSEEGKTQPCKQLPSFSSCAECFGLWSVLSGVLGFSCGLLCSALGLRSFPLICIYLSLVVSLPIDYACLFLREVPNILFHCFFFSADDFTLIKPRALQSTSFLWSLAIHSCLTSTHTNFLGKGWKPIFMNIFSYSFLLNAVSWI